MLLLLLLIIQAAVALPFRVKGEICTLSSQHFSTDDQQDIACYAGNFLVKMLGELNGGQNKTVEHVRVHLLPYLGGEPTLQALNSDNPDNPNCTSCYTDVATAKGLQQLRNELTPEQQSAYDRKQVCYVRLTQRVIENIKQSHDGVWLLPNQEYKGNEDEQVLDIFDNIYGSSKFDTKSCPIPE